MRRIRSIVSESGSLVWPAPSRRVERARGLRLPGLGGLLRGRRPRPEPPELIVVGLGNPGPEYARTRHNIGFRCVDLLASKYGVTLSRRHRSAAVGEGEIDGRRVVLAKPRTFVNRSGAAVSYLLARYAAAPERLLVVYDEMELPLGRVRLRPRGGAGGHNGLRSIVNAVGSEEVARLRVGIGRPPPGVDPVDYVLGEPAAEEEEAALSGSVELSVEIVRAVLTDGIDTAMNRHN